MKVRELIEKLGQYNPNIDVVVDATMFADIIGVELDNVPELYTREPDVTRDVDVVVLLTNGN